MARQDEIRVGDAERDAVMLALHDHFAAGRLDRGELDERLDTALTAKTHGDLRALVRDLPPPTGLPESATPPPIAVPWEPGGWGPMAHASHMNHMRHRHMRHMAGRRHHPRGPLKAFPLLLAVFLVLAFTAGPGAGFLVVLQVALAIWVIRAVLLAFEVRRSRHGA
ncbi:DUF1707 domain-containing protein [Actinomadura spongiicola]|uniref:DUF1707 domain-containing protein n=1 Tax=Actinomadura spongiicola TaxID=2303421 RepID=A0A372GBU8_9ACTN|nr:DUF1707 domain-containing protein [Actinomadura spongiicola]RFS82827.1 DUF1707 domain-containing protein [Actinomadura spongiicola]